MDREQARIFQKLGYLSIKDKIIKTLKTKMYEKTETNKTHKSLDLHEEEDCAAKVEVDWG